MSPHIVAVMGIIRTLVALALPVALTGCSLGGGFREPSPSDLLQHSAGKLQAAKTVHLDGTTTSVLKIGATISIDATLTGDVELPDRARVSATSSALGLSQTIETIIAGGRTYSKDPLSGGWTEGAALQDPTAVLDPLTNTDFSLARDVAEIDRTRIDGREVRHLGYTVDPDALRQRMTSGVGPFGLQLGELDVRGEAWIRTDDEQLVRQLVRATFKIDLPSFLATGASSAGIDLAMDLHYSRHGEPISPAITPPPSAVPRPTVPPFPSFSLPPGRFPIPVPSGLFAPPGIPRPSPTR